MSFLLINYNITYARISICDCFFEITVLLHGSVCFPERFFPFSVGFKVKEPTDHSHSQNLGSDIMRIMFRNRYLIVPIPLHSSSSDGLNDCEWKIFRKPCALYQFFSHFLYSRPSWRRVGVRISPTAFPVTDNPISTALR